MKRIFLIVIILGVVVWGFLWIRNMLPSTPTLATEAEIPTESGLTPVMELANSIWSQDIQWKEVVTKKSAEAQKNPESLKELAFAQSFIGDLSSAEASLDTYCQENAENGACRKIQYVFDIQEPVDNIGRPLAGTIFEVIGKSSTTQELSGADTVSDTMYKNTMIRTKITKKGYTDFLSRAMHIAWEGSTDTQQKMTLSPVMIPAEVWVTKKHSEAYEVKTRNYTFTVQPETFVYADGTLAEGDIEAYFFDITADTANVYASGMFSLDIFDRSGVYVGEGMQTYGMPLVKAYKWDTELYVKKPIIGVGRMTNMDDFKQKNNITEIDFGAVPKNTPLDTATAAQYWLPPFWQYQKRTGTWETSTFQVLDNTGLSQFSFQDF